MLDQQNKVHLQALADKDRVIAREREEKESWKDKLQAVKLNLAEAMCMLAESDAMLQAKDEEMAAMLKAIPALNGASSQELEGLRFPSRLSVS